MHKLFLSIPNWGVPLILCDVICRVIWLSHGPKMIGFIIHFLPPQPFKGEDRWRLQNLDAGVADFVAHARERGLITISSCSGLVKDHHESPYQAHIVFNLRSGDSKKLAWLDFFSFGGYWEFVNPDGLSCGQIFWPRNKAAIAPPSHWTTIHPRSGPGRDRILSGYLNLACYILPLIFKSPVKGLNQSENIS